MADAPEGLAITGATASGKTELAIAVAERVGGEIISMDSRQVYRGMDIGTAKARPDERERVPHHGLDLVDPGERYSAGRFARDARRWVSEIRARGRVPVLAGGTGFFLRALTHPLFREPAMDPDRRARLDAYLHGQSDQRLHRMLETLDPTTAERLAEQGGRQRVTRALEIALLTGRTLGWWHRNRPAEDRPVPLLIFVLHRPRPELDARIAARVDHMIEAGLTSEVRELLDAGHEPDAPGMTATGYPEIAAHLRGELSLEEAADRVRIRTRQYARRQLTWFRNKLPPGSIRLDGTRSLDDLVEEVAEQWKRA